MPEDQVLGMSFLIGVIVDRWWAAVLVIPVGYIASTTCWFEGFSDAELGVLFGIAAAVGIAVGVPTRKTPSARYPTKAVPNVLAGRSPAKLQVVTWCPETASLRQNVGG
jgi:uncharacterized membrane protein YfcA